MNSKKTRWGRQERKFATKPRCVITRHIFGYGRKSESRASSGCNVTTRGQTENRNHPIGIMELDLGPIVATPSIFHTEQTHVDGSNTKTNIKSPKKDPN